MVAEIVHERKLLARELHQSRSASSVLSTRLVRVSTVLIGFISPVRELNYTLHSLSANGLVNLQNCPDKAATPTTTSTLSGLMSLP